jgi:asparagine N-glycosylation enzyme membrane subunit Stt3
MGHLPELSVSLRIATVVVPVALYFLILGLLNSRRRPQLLRGRRDFALLIVALSPLFVLPVLHWSGGSWVIYNVTPSQAVRAVGDALRAAGLDSSGRDGAFDLTGRAATVQVSPFPLLRNVSIRMTGTDRRASGRFEAALARQLGGISAETTPMAMALLLVAAAMLVAPLAMVAPRAGEIVRILTGMLY